MKNRTARFTGGADSLTISLRMNREHIKTQVRLRSAEEKPKVGCKNYFDPNEDGERKAQESFDQLVKDAIAKGWAPHQKRERDAAFSAVPPAPGAKEPALRAAGRR